MGYPSQQDEITQLFNDPQNADVYASNLDDASKQRIQDMIAASSSIEVNGINNNMSSAEVYVTATTPQGGAIPYQVSLVRDGIGWKVSQVSLAFASQS